jgi:transaldolase
MKFFLDTANVEDIRKANDLGVICGVTTNPSLIAKEGRNFKEVIAEIASIAGHSNIHTTLLYTNPSKQKLKEKMNKL